LGPQEKASKAVRSVGNTEGTLKKKIAVEQTGRGGGNLSKEGTKDSSLK